MHDTASFLGYRSRIDGGYQFVVRRHYRKGAWMVISGEILPTGAEIELKTYARRHGMKKLAAFTAKVFAGPVTTPATALDYLIPACSCPS